MTAHNNGLSKRCDCARRKWTTCDHPWHFDFYLGRKYRYSLDVLAKARGEDPPRTKHAAEALADTVRAEIRKRTFRDPKSPAPAPTPDPTAAMTVGDVIDQYLTRHVNLPGRRPGGVATMQWALAVARRTEIPAAGGTVVRFEQRPMAAVTKADIDALRIARQAQAPAGSKGAGINRLLSRLRHVFAWAIVEGYIEATPFLRGGVPVIRLTPETSRDRRLREGEEAALLAHASPHLRDLIIAALSTGCRKGELLSLQWRDVRTSVDARGQTRQTLVLDPSKTKTARRRTVPVGQRLAAVLAMRRHAPDGTELGPEAYVFGNAVGEPVASVQGAWMTAVLKAHGHVPQWAPGTKNPLSAASRAAYRAINLHFHDLRREFGSLVLESGSSLIEARDLLGHSDVSQTSTYLESTARSLGVAIEKLDRHRDRADARRQQAESPVAEPLPLVETSDAEPTDTTDSDWVQ